MKKVKGFNNFTYSSTVEGLVNNTDDSTVKLNVNRYQTTIKKFYKEVGVELHHSSMYETSILMLISLVEKLMNEGDITIDPTIQNATMLTLFTVAVLTKESKDKVQKIYDYIKDNGIDDDDINKTLNQLTNIKEIFSGILKVSEKDVKTFSDMLAYTGVLIPFLNTFKSLFDNGFINIDIISLPYQEMKEAMGNTKFRLFINRVLHKLDIITKGTNKFQNKDNAKPLLANDELKSPMYKKESPIIEGNLSEETDDVKGKIERSKTLSKEMKDKILPLIIKDGIHGTKYIKGRVVNLKKPKVSGKSFKGVTLCADKNGFFVACRARSKSYPELDKIPNAEIIRVAATG